MRNADCRLCARLDSSRARARVAPVRRAQRAGGAGRADRACERVDLVLARGRRALRDPVRVAGCRAAQEGRAMSDPQKTGAGDLTYDLVSVFYHLLQGAETIETYERDAGADPDLGGYFR